MDFNSMIIIFNGVFVVSISNNLKFIKLIVFQTKVDIALTAEWKSEL